MLGLQWHPDQSKHSGNKLCHQLCAESFRFGCVVTRIPIWIHCDPWRKLVWLYCNQPRRLVQLVHVHLSWCTCINQRKKQYRDLDKASRYSNLFWNKQCQCLWFQCDVWLISYHWNHGNLYHGCWNIRQCISDQQVEQLAVYSRSLCGQSFVFVFLRRLCHGLFQSAVHHQCSLQHSLSRLRGRILHATMYSECIIQSGLSRLRRSLFCLSVQSWFILQSKLS